MAFTLQSNEEKALQIAATLAELSKVAEGFESVDSSIRDHEDPATTWVAKPGKMSLTELAELTVKAAFESMNVAATTRTYPYRWQDGAHAVAKTLRDIYGYPGFGEKIPATMFNPEQPPQMVSVAVSPTQKIEVPWGWISVPDLHAMLKMDRVRDPEKGVIFRLSVEAPKAYERPVRGLLEAINQTLQQHSIYKGKAITAAEDPDFLDLTAINPAHVIYSETVQDALQHEVWFPIQNREFMKADGQPTRWVVMFDGGYGTGKTLAMMLTAKQCQDNEISFIQVRPGRDDLKAAMQTAQLYAPSIIAFEDVDTVADPNKVNDTEISRLLDVFDGMGSKSNDVGVILTTNHSDRIHPGLLRAGRLHTYVKFEDLDARALTKLITIRVGQDRLRDLDGDTVYEACKGFEPAFMDLVIQVARRYAASRHTEHLVASGRKVTPALQRDYRIGTADLVSAAHRLRPQHELMKGASADARKPMLEDLFRQLNVDSVQGMVLKDTNEDVGPFIAVHNMEQQQEAANK